MADAQYYIWSIQLGIEGQDQSTQPTFHPIYFTRSIIEVIQTVINTTVVKGGIQAVKGNLIGSSKIEERSGIGLWHDLLLPTMFAS